MGDKATARCTMDELGVPTVPGSDGVVSDSVEAARIANEIGFPVMIKASAGGGGKGMRIAPDAKSFGRLLQAAQTEAQAAFGDDTIYLERCIVQPRHIEFQIFGEGYPAGTVMQSPIYDLGSVRNATGLRWAGEVPANTRAEIRTRSGNQLRESYVFHDKNGKEVTQKKYDKLIPSFKGQIDTVRGPGDDWSIWSQVYDSPGQGFLSPMPRRFIQFQVNFHSDDPQRAAALDELVLTYDAPLAAATRAEIDPVEARPGERTAFTYYLSWDASGGGRGFDQLLMRSGAEIEPGPIRADVPLVLRPEPGAEAYGRVEASKGELAFYLVSDGGISPYRCKIRSPSLINLTVTEHLLVGWKLADMIVAMGSIDINMGEVDR